MGADRDILAHAEAAEGLHDLERARDAERELRPFALVGQRRCMDFLTGDPRGDPAEIEFVADNRVAGANRSLGHRRDEIANTGTDRNEMEGAE